MSNGGATAQRFLALGGQGAGRILKLILDSYVAIPDLCVEGKHYLVHASTNQAPLYGPAGACEDMGSTSWLSCCTTWFGDGPRMNSGRRPTLRAVWKWGEGC